MVAACIYIKSKQRNISYQAPHSKKSYELVLAEEEGKEFFYTIIRKPHHVNDYKYNQRSNKSENQAQLQAVAFKKECSSFFQVVLFVYSGLNRTAREQY